MIRISIIMGVYNCENTLSEAIESILQQSYADWKLIMCDDGSTDDTFAVAKRYAQKYPQKILLIQNDFNIGLNKTLNKCLQYVDTEYVARMDGDDISLPTRLEKEIQFLDNHPEYAIVSTQMIYFDENGAFRRSTGKGEPIITSLAKGTPFCHAPCMVRSDAYQAVNGYSEEQSRLRVEDWDLWIRMYEKGYRGFNLQEALYKMRDDRNAIKRRKLKYRFNEATVSAFAVNKLKLCPIYYSYCIIPILKGLLPTKLYTFLHRYS